MKLTGIWSFSVVLAALTACASMYDQPYALIETGMADAVRKQAPVGVTKIDGVQTRSTFHPDPVPPGKRTITLSLSSSAATPAVEQPTRVVELVVEPCKRYRLVARYEEALSGKWEPEVQAVEDIPECKRKFKDAK